MITRGVYKNSGTPKSSILIGFSIINHPFWGTPIFENTTICQTESLKIGLLKGKGLSSNHQFSGAFAGSFSRVVQGGSLPAIRNSAYKDEITPVTHIFSAMYRGYFTPFITTSWWLNQPI